MILTQHVYRDGKEDVEATTSKKSTATECTLVVGGLPAQSLTEHVYTQECRALIGEL